MIQVVAFGTVNAGKSSLLSALIDHHGLFCESEKPGKTDCIQTEEAYGIRFIDTPGLDCDYFDEKLAYAAAQKADVMMFCHNLRTGELKDTEIKALKEYNKIADIWNTCFVLTHEDALATRDITKQTANKIVEQLNGLFKLKFTVFGMPHQHVNLGERKPRPLNIVGTDTYWHAKKKQGVKSEMLMRFSGIPKLREFLFRIRDTKGSITKRK